MSKPTKILNPVERSLVDISCCKISSTRSLIDLVLISMVNQLSKAKLYSNYEAIRRVQSLSSHENCKQVSV